MNFSNIKNIQHNIIELHFYKLTSQTKKYNNKTHTSIIKLTTYSFKVIIVKNTINSSCKYLLKNSS